MKKNKPFDVSKLDEICIFKGEGDLIEFYREGKYIYLKKPKEPNRYFRFNLQTGKFERINIYKTVDNKITEVATENITFWFTDCTLITKDIHFGRLVVFAKYNRAFDRYSSPVRFIEQLGSSIISNIEKWEAIGMKVDEIEEFFSNSLVSESFYNHHDYRETIYYGDVPCSFSTYYSGRLNYAPGDFNKKVLKYILNTYDSINNDILHKIHYNYNNNEAIVEEELNELCKNPEYEDALTYTSDSYRDRGTVYNLLDSSDTSFYLRISLIHLVQEYNLDLKSLLKFLKRQRNVESNGISYLIGANHYRDYLSCERDLKHGSLSKMVKYPKNFRTRFHIVQEEYNAKKASIDRKKFRREKMKHADYEYVGKEFIIRIPEDPNEINIEAAELDHCVRIYIPKVSKGETLILFLRYKAYPKIPYVTLEVKNGILNQAYGRNDSKPEKEALDFLKSWCKKKNIKVGCWRRDLE